MADQTRTRELARRRKCRQRDRERDRKRADPLGAHPFSVRTSSVRSSLSTSTGPKSTGMMETREDDRRLALVIPLWWIDRLRGQRRVPQHLWVTALVVLYWQTQTRRSSFWVSSTDLFPTCGMSRYAIRRALNRLRDLGLIRILRCRGWMPWVTIVTAPPADPTHQTWPNGRTCDYGSVPSGNEPYKDLSARKQKT